MSDEESTGTFGVALGANAVIAGAKLAGRLVTGPPCCCPKPPTPSPTATGGSGLRANNLSRGGGRLLVVNGGSDAGHCRICPLYRSRVPGLDA